MGSIGSSSMISFVVVALIAGAAVVVIGALGFPLNGVELNRAPMPRLFPGALTAPMKGRRVLTMTRRLDAVALMAGAGSEMPVFSTFRTTEEDEVGSIAGAALKEMNLSATGSLAEEVDRRDSVAVCGLTGDELGPGAGRPRLLASSASRPARLPPPDLRDGRKLRELD